jgi:hypothetical protein
LDDSLGNTPSQHRNDVTLVFKFVHGLERNKAIQIFFSATSVFAKHAIHHHKNKLQISIPLNFSMFKLLPSNIASIESLGYGENPFLPSPNVFKVTRETKQNILNSCKSFAKTAFAGHAKRLNFPTRIESSAQRSGALLAWQLACNFDTKNGVHDHAATADGCRTDLWIDTRCWIDGDIAGSPPKNIWSTELKSL